MDYPPYNFDPAYSRPLGMPPMAGRPYQLPGSDNGYGMSVYTPAGQYTAINLMRGNTHPPPPPAWHPPLAYTGANTNVPRPWEY